MNLETNTTSANENEVNNTGPNDNQPPRPLPSLGSVYDDDDENRNDLTDHDITDQNDDDDGWKDSNNYDNVTTNVDHETAIERSNTQKNHFNPYVNHPHSLNTTTTTTTTTNNNNNNNSRTYSMDYNFYYNTNKEKALMLDMHILKTLLHRNHSSHGRTIYYRRTHMALCHVKNTILLLSSSAPSTTQAKATSTTLFQDWEIYFHQHTLIPLQQQLNRLIHNSNTNTRSVPKDLTRTLVTKTNLHANTIPGIIEKLMFEFTNPTPTTSSTSFASTTTSTQMLHRILYDITDCIGRIEYAFTAGRMEIVRGFFLSILTILMAALARIYVLLLQLQYTILLQYTQYLSQLHQTMMHFIQHNSMHSNSTAVNAQPFIDQIQHLQQNVFKPMLHCIYQKLTKHHQDSTKAVQQQQQQHRTRQQRTESSLHSLGLNIRQYHQSCPTKKNRKRSLSPPETVAAAGIVTSTSADDILSKNTTTTAILEDIAIRTFHDNVEQVSNINPDVHKAIGTISTATTPKNSSIDRNVNDDDDSTTRNGSPFWNESSSNDVVYDDDNDDDDDVGELQFGGGQHQQQSVQQKRTRSINNDSAVVGLDQNMNAVQQFKQQRIRQQKKLARTASMMSDCSNSHSSTTHITDRCNDNEKTVIAANAITKKLKSKKDGTRKKKKKDGHKSALGDDFFDKLFR